MYIIMKFKHMHPADQLVMMMNRLYYNGLTTTSGGNLSIKDDEGNIWITPGGYDKGRLTRADIVKVLPSGEIVGKHNPSVELPFHRMAMEVTGAKAIMHAHPPALVTVSLLGAMPNIAVLPNIGGMIKGLAVSEYDLPGSIRLGEKIAAVFAKGYDAVMMDNHGIVISADSIFEAYKKFEAMEYSANLMMESRAISKEKSLYKKQIAAFSKFKSRVGTAEFASVLPNECDVRNDMVSFSKRSVWQKLFTSFQGIYAARLSGNSFVIMPDDVDRDYIDADDIVRVENGGAEKGKKPSVFSELAHDIFAKNAEIGAISISQPLNAMAFGVTGAELDSKTIPESYIMMREVYRMSYDEFMENPNMVSDIISLKCPVVIVENFAVITAGANLTKAFDSLEVTDFTSRTIINSKKLKSLGALKKITKAQVDEINVAFKLL